MKIPVTALQSRNDFEAYCRKGTLASGPVWGNEGLCKVLGDFLLFVDLEDESLTPHLIRDGFWESWISVAMCRNIRADMNCIDIGANFGYYTMLMSQATTGRVLACEPMLDFATNIRRSCKMNDIENVEFCVQAISDTFEELVELRIPGKLKGSSSIVLWSHPPVAHFYDKEGFKVYTNTVDILTEDWTTVDFVKIDVEGAERLVWRGMQQTIDKNPDIAVFMEVAKDRYDLDEFLDEIEDSGMTISLVEEDGNINLASRSRIMEEELDMLALRRDPWAWTTIGEKGLASR